MTAKADRVKQLLSDPDLKEAFQNVREFYRDKIEETPLSSKNDEAIHDIRKMLHLLRQVEQDLHKSIERGHLEDFYAAQDEERGFLGDVLKWPKNSR